METEIYNQLKSVPQEYLKIIGAGRLKGMSDIKPQWRILRLTEVFGECGFGWKIQNLTFQYEKSNENEIVCNCRLEFLYKKDDVWSEPIPATGGSKFMTMERNGSYVSDEAEKMAYTDAISVATKMVGLASDIYMGFGGKYDTKKPFLTKMQGKEFTKEWASLQRGIINGDIQSVDDAKVYFDMSKETEEEIKNLLK